MNRNLNLSDRFKNKLCEDGKWQTYVDQAYRNVVDYFFCSPRFFPEYTNHGILHIDRMIELCDKLIPDEKLSDIKPRELGILIIAVIMHDIGMFIEEDGMKKILCGNRSTHKTEFLDDYSWKEEWNRYYHTILRYSDKKMQRIFGMIDSPKYLLDEKFEVTNKNILIYGDFLRRNHARLAYEIINDGFPGAKDIDVLRNIEIGKEIRDIIGLVARSHGMKLRDTSEYLEGNYGLIAEPKNIRIFYLMAILRMADYLDAGYDRASHVIEAMKTIHSVVSKEEFSWNQVIDYEDYDWKLKTETLVIHADPTCSNQFLKIENWLHELQKELDLCWAVLGEVYGGSVALSLTIRRITSNILMERTRKHFEKHFVTKRAFLDTNPDILKLLIYPLYNEESKYGIRELLQNAIDACNEREKIERRKGNDEYTPQVIVEIDRVRNEFCITDNGLGMTEDVIINYFLISGASFRNSALWEEKFMQDGESQVVRTGKFGIGVLSAFLLGNYVEVTTRAVNESLGYNFGIEIGRDNINIERKEADVGTRLKISSTSKILDEIVMEMNYPRWNDWYCFQEPKVKYILDGNEVFHEEEYVPNEEEEFDGWYQLEGTEFTSYKWSYESVRFLGINVFCNGIPVIQGTELEALKYGFPLKTPILSIVDYNNKVHINLARNRLTEFPSEEIFIKEGYKFVIMRLLELVIIEGYESCSRALQGGFPYSKDLKITGRSQVTLSHYIFSKKGYMLMNPAFLKHAGTEDLILLCVKSSSVDDFSIVPLDIPIWLCGMGTFRRRSFLKRAFTSIFEQEDIKEDVVQFVVEKNFYDTELKDYFNEQGIDNRIELWEESSKIYNFAVDIEKNNEYKKDMLCVENFSGVEILVAIRYHLTYQDSTNLMQELLQSYLGTTTWIPYDYATRKEVCREAFEKLNKYSVSGSDCKGITSK